MRSLMMMTMRSTTNSDNTQWGRHNHKQCDHIIEHGYEPFGEKRKAPHYERGEATSEYKRPSLTWCGISSAMLAPNSQRWWIPSCNPSVQPGSLRCSLQSSSRALRV